MERKTRKRASSKIGLPPGTLVHIGDVHQGEARISLVDYTHEYAHEMVCGQLEDCLKYRDTESRSWIRVEGLHDIKLIEQVGKHFDLHPLLLEDILNTTQRPKAEDFTDYIFLTAKILTLDPAHQDLVKEQVSFVLGKKYLLSFQEKSSNVFTPIRDRILTGLGRVRKLKDDYLFYLLIDLVVDNYFVVTKALDDIIHKLEEEVIENCADEETLKKIQKHRKQLIGLRKEVIPLREAIGKIEKLDSPLVEVETDRYFSDVLDHTLRIIDSIEIYRETLNNVLEIHLLNSSNKMNQVMKVLTIISTIFMPLTFIVGVYGMNFDFMPELHYRYSYPIVILFMIVVVIIMLNYFRKKDWF